MTDSTHLLHDLVQISRTGTEFYEEAAKSVADKKLKRVFADMRSATSSTCSMPSMASSAWMRTRTSSALAV